MAAEPAQKVVIETESGSRYIRDEAGGVSRIRKDTDGRPITPIVVVGAVIGFFAALLLGN